jgi:RHS repeat-associated protein
MSHHPNFTPASPSLASPLLYAAFDSYESITTSFATSLEPILETTTVTEVVLGYHRNQQYSITAMTTSTGAVAERYAYTTYGQPTICNASGSPIGNQQSQIANRFTYTGREWDETLGLHHFRARWMSSLAGRFLGRDPIGYEDGLSTYTFVLNSPLDASDPSGLIKLSDCYAYSEKEVFKLPPASIWRFEFEAAFEMLLSGQLCRKDCGEGCQYDRAAYISGTLSGKLKFKLSGPGAITVFGVPITFKWYGGADGGMYGTFCHDMCNGNMGYKKCSYLRAFFGFEKSDEIDYGPMNGSKISVKRRGVLKTELLRGKRQTD